MIILNFFAIVCNSQWIQYQCTDVLADFGQTCIDAVSEILVEVSACKTPYYCPPTVGPFRSEWSAAQPSVAQVSWPGEPCATTSNWAYGTCLSHIWNGRGFNDTCTVSDECNPGLYCDKIGGFQGYCATQKLEFETWLTDSDWVNNAGCNKRSDDPDGYCLRYLSQSSGAEVFDQATNYKLCSNYFASQSDSSSRYYCTDQLRLSRNGAAATWAANSDCVSNEDTVTQQRFNTTCEWGYNAEGISFCNLFPGDDGYVSWLSILNQWYRTQDIAKCNTVRREADACIEYNWADEDKKTTYFYFKQLVDNFPRLQQNSNCIKDVYTPIYWELQAEYQTILDADDVEKGEDFAFLVGLIMYTILI